jgi:hypothetical protein
MLNKGGLVQDAGVKTNTHSAIRVLIALVSALPATVAKAQVTEPFVNS